MVKFSTAMAGLGAALLVAAAAGPSFGQSGFPFSLFGGSTGSVAHDITTDPAAVVIVRVQSTTPIDPATDH